MSRVTDAMRRAGQLQEESSVTHADDTFVGGDESATPDPMYTTPTPALEVHAPRAALAEAPAQRERAIPIEVSRSDSGDDIRILDVVGMLYRRRWMIAGVIVAAVVAAVAYNRTATPIFEARARVLIEPNAADVVPFRSTSEDPSRLDYFVTQLEVLRSRGLARRTLEDLRLLDKNENTASSQISDLMGRVTVVPVTSAMGESRVINITVQSANPELAAKLANGLSSSYVAQNLDEKRQGSRDASSWLTQRLEELRTQLQKSETALQQYREQKDSVSLGDQQNIVMQKLAQLNSAVTSARTERLQKEQVYRQLMDMKQRGASLDSFSPISSSGFIQNLKAELANLERDRRQMSQQLGDLHPDMIKVNTAIANAERRLSEEMSKIVDGIENDYKAAVSNEAALNGTLEAQKREVLKLNHQSIEYSALARDASSTQEMFETVRKRVKETEISGELQSNNAKVLDVAEVPGSPILPRKELNVLIALFGGGFFGVCLAFGLETLNPHLARPSDIAESLGLPLLGVAPRVREWKGSGSALSPDSPAFQEALRAIRTRIFLSPIASDARSMAVTSTNPGEGKTTMASSLAVSMAKAGRRVLLVDGDLRRPQLHRVCNLPQAPGLADVMLGDAKPSDALRESTVAGLFVMTAGTEVANPTDLLDNERLHQLIQGFRQIFDVIVLDCPPVLAVSDASILANAASSVMFVVGSGGTSREAARAAVDRLTSVQAQVVGVVLNNAKLDQQVEYGYTSYVNSAQRSEKSVAGHA